MKNERSARASRSVLIRLTLSLSALCLFLGIKVSVTAADVSAIWQGGNGWSCGTCWSSAPAFPNNSGGVTYDATIPSNGNSVRLDGDITIEHLNLQGTLYIYSPVSLSLTLNAGLVWTSGELVRLTSDSSVPSINLGPGSISTISAGGRARLEGVILNNLGDLSQTTDIDTNSYATTINNAAGASWSIQQHVIGRAPGPFTNYPQFTFENSGDLTSLDGVFYGLFSNSGNVTVQSNIGTLPPNDFEGVPDYHGLILNGSGAVGGNFHLTEPAALVFRGPGNVGWAWLDGLHIDGTGTVAIRNQSVQVYGDITIDPNLEIYSPLNIQQGHTVVLNGATHINQAGLSMFAATIRNPNHPIIATNQVEVYASGTVDGDLTIVGSRLTANNTAALTINGTLELNYFPDTSPSSAYATKLSCFAGSQSRNPLLSVGKELRIDRALLFLNFANDFPAAPLSSEIFTIIHADEGITGEFFKCIDGDRITDWLGKQWFQVNYGPNSAYGQNDIVLSNATTSLIENGNFQDVSAGGSVGIVPHWSVIGNVAAVWDYEGWTSPYGSVALSATTNSEGDSISQSFPTVVGQTYALDFDSGIFGVPNGDPLRLRVRVFGNGTLLDDIQTLPAANTFDSDAVVFHHYRYRFTANSTTTTLQFSNIGLGNAGADQMIDNVIVGLPLPSPTPTTLPLRNRDFEQARYDGLGVVPGWTISGNGKLKATAQGATSGTHSAAFSATGDSQGNVLSQRFVTVPGGVYSLDFDSGIFGKRTGAALQLRTQVIGSTSRLDQTVAPPDANTFAASAVAFRHYHYTFTADSVSTTLQFSDIGVGNAAADVELDTVSVLPRITSTIASLPTVNPVQITGTFLPGRSVEILQSFDLVNYTSIAVVQCDQSGAFAQTFGFPGPHAAFYKVVSSQL